MFSVLHRALERSEEHKHFDNLFTKQCHHFEHFDLESGTSRFCQTKSLVNFEFQFFSLMLSLPFSSLSFSCFVWDFHHISGPMLVPTLSNHRRNSFLLDDSVLHLRPREPPAPSISEGHGPRDEIRQLLELTDTVTTTTLETTNTNTNTLRSTEEHSREPSIVTEPPKLLTQSNEITEYQQRRRLDVNQSIENREVNARLTQRLMQVEIIGPQGRKVKLAEEDHVDFKEENKTSSDEESVEEVSSLSPRKVRMSAGPTTIISKRLLHKREQSGTTLTHIPRQTLVNQEKETTTPTYRGPINFNKDPRETITTSTPTQTSTSTSTVTATTTLISAHKKTPSLTDEVTTNTNKSTGFPYATISKGTIQHNHKPVGSHAHFKTMENTFHSTKTMTSLEPSPKSSSSIPSSPTSTTTVTTAPTTSVSHQPKVSVLQSSSNLPPTGLLTKSTTTNTSSSMIPPPVSQIPKLQQSSLPNLQTTSKNQNSVTPKSSITTDTNNNKTFTSPKKSNFTLSNTTSIEKHKINNDTSGQSETTNDNSKNPNNKNSHKKKVSFRDTEVLIKSASNNMTQQTKITLSNTNPSSEPSFSSTKSTQEKGKLNLTKSQSFLPSDTSKSFTSNFEKSSSTLKSVNTPTNNSSLISTTSSPPSHLQSTTQKKFGYQTVKFSRYVQL